MTFYTYPTTPWEEILPHTSEQARELVAKLVCYQSTDRLTAAEVGLPNTIEQLLCRPDTDVFCRR